MMRSFEVFIVDELTYRSYAHNRRMFPHVAPERWAVIFSNAEALEARYLRECLR